MISARDPARGAYSTAIDLVAVFKGPTSKRRQGEDGLDGNERGKGRRRREGEELGSGSGGEVEGRGSEGKGFVGPM